MSQFWRVTEVKSEMEINALMPDKMVWRIILPPKIFQLHTSFSRAFSNNLNVQFQCTKIKIKFEIGDHTYLSQIFFGVRPATSDTLYQKFELKTGKYEKKVSIYYTFAFAQNAQTFSEETIYEQMNQNRRLYFTCFSTFSCTPSLWRNFSTIFTLKRTRSFLGVSRHRDLGTEIYCIIL